MTTIKVLIEGVGSWEKGAIVKDAPPGLVHMAKAGTTNAATGQRIAELVDDDGDDKKELKELKADAKRLKIDGYGKMTTEELKVAIASVGKAITDAEEAAKKKQAEEDELKQLQAKAAELKIADFEKLGRDKLNAAIEAAGGGKGAE